MKTRQNLGKALITGASSGIGAVYADRLAKRGYDLILVARDGLRLQTAAKRLSTEYGIKVEVLPADLTKADDLLGIERVLQSDTQVSLLVNNAGAAIAGALVDAKPDDLANLIALNVTSLVRLTRAVVPALIQRKNGAIINIASVVALAPGMVSATYSATKAFVLNFTQAMQQELKDKGVYIQAVLPGATRTEIWQRASVDIDQVLPKDAIMTTENMVDTSLIGFDQKELITIPTLPDVNEWNAFEAARAVLGPKLSLATPAARYSR